MVTATCTAQQLGPQPGRDQSAVILMPARSVGPPGMLYMRYHHGQPFAYTIPETASSRSVLAAAASCLPSHRLRGRFPPSLNVLWDGAQQSVKAATQPCKKKRERVRYVDT